MDNKLFIIVLVAAAAVIGAAGLSRYINNLRIGERMAARKAALRIENATADDALSDPLLRSLIACPQCGTAGQFDVLDGKQCRCHNCAAVWDVG